MEITPRIYQITAVKAAIKALHRVKRALVVMATGLGKTFTAAFITQELRPQRTLFLVHNNYILDHAITEFRQIFPKESQMAIYNGMSKNGAAEADIVFATWQTMGKNLNDWARNHFDLIIVDEAHHTEAETYRPVLDYFNTSKLGITATPNRGDKVDIRGVFGSEVVNLTLEEAIAKGWLPRIEYHVMTDESLDDKVLEEIVKEIRDSKKRFTMAEVNRRLFIRKRDDEVARIINSYNEKAIVFCPTIPYTKTIADSLELAAVFHSSVGTDQKDTMEKNLAVLEDLNIGVIRRVCAVNAFNEGVNVPSVGLVAFCRVTDSETIFRQQLGRGLRPGKDKLIVLDFVGNLERIQAVIKMVNKISELSGQGSLSGDSNHEGSKRQHFEVTGKGFEFTFTDKIADIVEVLHHCEIEFYATWQEASAAAIKLKIKDNIDYKQRYKEDPRLPYDPYQLYSNFPGWPIFLVTGRSSPRSVEDFYTTWQEASAAAIKLKIKDDIDYRQKYKKDPRLPSAPFKIYPDFPGWGIFLETGRPVRRSAEDFYATWQEAYEAAIKLKITDSIDYNEKYKKDQRLPSSPEKIYANFPGWYVFLGKEEKYTTWQEASVAAIKLKIKNSIDYNQRYKEDPRLPCTPQEKYPNFPGWYVYLGKEKKKKYATWQEASVAAIKLKIKDDIDYKQRYKEDPRLPSNPYQKYLNFPGIGIFLGTGRKKYHRKEVSK